MCYKIVHCMYSMYIWACYIHACMQYVSAIIVLMIITGTFVNGPYAMITTAVSADLVSSPYNTYHSSYCHTAMYWYMYAVVYYVCVI